MNFKMANIKASGGWNYIEIIQTVEEWSLNWPTQKNQRRDFVEGTNVENAWEGWETLDLCGMGNAYSEQTHYPGKLNHRHNKNVFAKSNPKKNDPTI